MRGFFARQAQHAPSALPGQIEPPPLVLWLVVIALRSGLAQSRYRKPGVAAKRFFPSSALEAAPADGSRPNRFFASWFAGRGGRLRPVRLRRNSRLEFL
jgi:hypothetical protein